MTTPPKTRVAVIGSGNIGTDLMIKVIRLSRVLEMAANIDEFTETTAKAIEVVGGAERGKAIIILNPAEPPLIMRDTVFCLAADADPDAIRDSVERMVKEVAAYVPGYRLKQEVQVSRISEDEPLHTLIRAGAPRPALKVSVFLEVTGAAHYLPSYAGNLDIMTSAALRTAERLAASAAQPEGQR